MSNAEALIAGIHGSVSHLNDCIPIAGYTTRRFSLKQYQRKIAIFHHEDHKLKLEITFKIALL